MLRRPLTADWVAGLDADRVLRAQGADPAATRRRSPRAVAIAERALREGIPLLDPVVVERHYGVAGADRHRVRLVGGGVLTGPLPAGRFGTACEIAVLAVCIGPALEAAVASAMPADPAFGLALDGLGTAAVDALATSCRERVVEGAAARGWRTSAGLGPGLEGWPLERGQRELFALLGESPVRLGASGMMSPRKSVTMVVGQGPGMRDDLSACELCGARTRCRHRTKG